MLHTKENKTNKRNSRLKGIKEYSQEEHVQFGKLHKEMWHAVLPVFGASCTVCSRSLDGEYDFNTDRGYTVRETCRKKFGMLYTK